MPATHAVVVEGEILGQSIGEPNQSFRLQHAPILTLAEDEWVEIEEKRYGEIEFVPWQPVGGLLAFRPARPAFFWLTPAAARLFSGRQSASRMVLCANMAGCRKPIVRFVSIDTGTGGGVKGNLPAGQLAGIDRIPGLCLQSDQFETRCRRS